MTIIKRASGAWILRFGLLSKGTTMRHHCIISTFILPAVSGCSATTSVLAATPAITVLTNSPDAKVPTPDQRVSISCIVGDWESLQFGRQLLTTRADGTGTIQMSLTPMAAVIYGRNVTLDLRWRLDGNMLTQEIVGGSPAKSVNKLIAKFGSTQSYQVLEYQSDYLLVSDGKTDSKPVRWNAVAMAE